MRGERERGEKEERREREKERERERGEKVTDATLFCGHLSQRECVGVVCGQVKTNSRALCPNAMCTQIDTRTSVEPTS